MEAVRELAGKFAEGEEVVEELYAELTKLQGCRHCLAGGDGFNDAMRAMDRSGKQGTRDWKEKRRGLVTASECASVLGRNPYQSAQKLLMTKCNIVKFSGNAYTQHGQDMEPIAIQRYEHETGHTVDSFGLLVNPKYSWIGGSPDGITRCGRLIEVKCPVVREIIPGEVPAHYMDQIQMLLHITGLKVADFIEMKGSEFHIVEVNKDPRWWGKNREALHTFHQQMQECRLDPTLCPRPKKRKPRFDFA